MFSWKGKKSLKQKFHKHTTEIRKKEFKTKALQTYNRYKKNPTSLKHTKKIESSVSRL